ncbi:MAG: ATPase [Planctomycetales bacterium 12-60-4]|nr:MAG: ATPase [Planctomycetales bacterium 12-60-4]
MNQRTRPVALATSAPQSPASLLDAGLSLGFVSEMVLKLLYAHGSLVGQDIAHQIRLPFPIIDEGLRFLKDQRCIEVSGGEIVGRVSYRFALTELGRLRARETFDQCRYVGPAPVTMDQYVAQCRRQTVMGIPCTPETLQTAFDGFILRPGLLEDLGPAVCSGRSIFVYGPPGNGKTVIAKGLGRYLNSFGGDIYVPYAIQAENSIITVYAPVLHQATDEAELVRRGVISKSSVAGPAVPSTSTDTTMDLRWRRIRRPVIITGGELTLDMLELQLHKTGNFYNAPLHIKANGGVFLIDDFGRQLVSPKDLLNRWIVPLEEKIDYLSLTSGRKFALPFEQLIVFSTNLDPKDLVDDAFLRRIRYKIRIDPPSRAIYSQIFATQCQQRGVATSDAVVDYVFNEYYDKGRVPRSSDPRDLLDLAQALCRFHDCPLTWKPEVIQYAAGRLFHEI